MSKLFDIVYNLLVVPSLWCAAIVGSWLEPKLAQRRRDAAKSLKALKSLRPCSKRVWFHAASMGEFEQLKSVISTLRKQDAECQIIVSFFSSSGFIPTQNTPLADAVVYCPLDSPGAVRSFLNILQPQIAVFDRYDLWWNMSKKLKNRKIPLFIVNAVYSNSGFYRTAFGRWYYKQIYSTAKRLYIARESDVESFRQLLDDRNNKVCQFLPDTRMDRVLEAVQAATQAAVLPSDSFSDNDLVLILGSVWEQDLAIVAPVLRRLGSQFPQLRCIIVPHEPVTKSLLLVESLVDNCQRLSDIQHGTPFTKRHLLVDSLGYLLRLYSVADLAYVGGGFGKGVHSVVEAAAHAIPIACGPVNERNVESGILAQRGGLRIVQSEQEFENWLLECINDPSKRSVWSEANRAYVDLNKGSSLRACSEILSEITTRS